MAAPASSDVWIRAAAALRRWFLLPTSPALLAAHRETVLLRARGTAVIAAVVMPFTILGYLWRVQPELLTAGAWISGAASLAALVLVFGLRGRVFERHYHLPFVLLVAVVCYPAEVVVLMLTGGAAASTFLFPFFLILFCVATMFPAGFAWAFLAAAAAPAAYAGGVLLTGGFSGEGEWGRFILLVNSAFIATFANRVTTRTFFSEAEHRVALELANRRLREAERARSELFTGLSHDLRNPLTLVLAPLSALDADREHLSEDQRFHLALARGGAARVDAMINDLLELARIEDGTVRLERRPVDLRAQVRALCDATGAHARSLGLALSCDVPDRAVIVVADADKLDRVLLNLLSNACKFSARGGQVKVALEEEGPGHVLVRVTDHGRGIAAGEQTAIFQRFVRGRDAEDARIPGSGLGLAVVKQFVELHGGQVLVQSEPGRGATFTVRLPRGTPADVAPVEKGPLIIRSRPPPALLLPPVLPAAGPPRDGLPRLLVVEDSSELMQFLEVELADAFSVTPVGAASAALEALRQREAFDALLTDVMLPGTGGLQLCASVRATPATAHLPVVVFSARGDVQMRLAAFAAGADDFLIKPFDPLELRARLLALLRRGQRSGPAPPSPARSA